MGESTGMSAVTTAITNMATSVQTEGLNTLAAILPVMAVLIAAIIVARLGVKMVRQWGK